VGNDAIHGTKFETDDDVICQMRTWLHERDKAWYWQGTHTIVRCWREAIEVDRDFEEKQSTVKSSLFITCGFHDL
jgi:hypothetical protein